MARIVIVDDDTSFSGLLKQFLETRGHQILVAESVGVLQLRLREDRPDVVILDMQVPGGGAPSAAKLLEQDAGLRKLPILFCSGMPVEQMQRWFPPQAGRRYQMKPVDLDSVGRLIGELLGLPPAAAPAGRPAAAKPAPAPAKPAAQPAGAAPASSQAGPTALLSAVVQRELMALSKLHGEALGQGAERLVSAILTEAVRLGASDIHIEPSRQSVAIRYRIDGVLRDQGVFPRNLAAVGARLRVSASLSPAPPALAVPEQGSFDISVEGHWVRARLSSFPTVFGDKLAIRLLRSDDASLTLESRGFLPNTLERLRALLKRRSGMIFVCGLTGSGKTSTLCCMLHALANREANLMTLEDPVEYVVPGVVHCEVRNGSGFGFAEGARALLRQDPDVLMLGEIRDRETGETALRAAAAGHLVLASIHATDAVSVPARLIGMGIDPIVVSQSLIGCLAQRLVRKACSGCASAAAVAPALLDAALAGALPAEAQAVRRLLEPSSAKPVAAPGCAACAGAGFSGRTGLFELVVDTPEFRRMIVDRAQPREMLAKAIEEGTHSLLMDAAAKVAAGWTPPAEAFAAAMKI